jgi:hypothetical protein
MLLRGPSGLAFDNINRWLYFVDAGIAENTLFFVQIDNPATVVTAGVLVGGATNAAFFQGKYCYMNQINDGLKTDDLRCVTLNGDGAIGSDDKDCRRVRQQPALPQLGLWRH